MKHLKSYKIFENIDNVNDIINDIRDIVVELEDEGFDVYINDEESLGQIKIMFQKNMVNGSGEIFNIYEIKECVDRILNFLSMDSRNNIDLDETTFTAIDRSYNRYELYKIKNQTYLHPYMNDDNLLMFVMYLREMSSIHENQIPDRGSFGNIKESLPDFKRQLKHHMDKYQWLNFDSALKLMNLKLDWKRRKGEDIDDQFISDLVKQTHELEER